MNYPLFFKALKFACLPTLAVLIVLFFGFFDIQETLKFISSNQTSAVVIRVGVILAEILLVSIIYNNYLNEYKREQAKNPENRKDTSSKVNYHQEIYRLFDNASTSYDTFHITNTEHPDFKFIEIKRAKRT